MILFDLDDFKQYNDSQGHQAGDGVLCHFADLLANETRAMNLAVRYGGDEFLCILSDTDYHGGTIHAGRVVESVRDDPGMEGVGVSAGVASFEKGMESPDVLIRKADEELYRSKAAADGEVATS